MLEKLRIIFTIPELRQKILLTLFLLAIYRIGWQVPLPIVDQEKMAAQAQQQGGFADLLRTVAEAYSTASPALVRCGWGQERNRNGGGSHRDNDPRQYGKEGHEAPFAADLHGRRPAQGRTCLCLRPSAFAVVQRKMMARRRTIAQAVR